MRRTDSVTDFLARIGVLIDTGDFDAAETVLRGYPIASAMVGAPALHDFFATRKSGHTDSLLTTQRPALLICVAMARMSVAGEVTSLAASLIAAGERLRRDEVLDPVTRARDLALAAVAFHFAGDAARSTEVGNRGSDLVSAIEVPVGEQPPSILLSAAADLAFTGYLVGDLGRAAAMWTWMRERLSDPLESTLRQADWGLSILGVSIGVRSLVAPMFREMLDEHQGKETSPQSVSDP